MNKTLCALLFFSSIQVQAQDLILQTRVEQNTLNNLIDKTRVVLKNNDIADQLSGRVDYDSDASFTIDELVTSDNYRKFAAAFTSVFGLDLKSAKIKVGISKIDYKINKVRVKPINLQVNDPVLDLHLTAFLDGLEIGLPTGLKIDLIVTDPKSKKEISILSGQVNPIALTVPNTIEPISFDVDFETRRDQDFYYTLKNYNLNAIPGMVNRNIDKFAIQDLNKNKRFSADSISVNPITIKLNGMFTRTLTFDTFKPIVQKKMNGILTKIFSELGVSLQKSIGPKILSTIFTNKSRSDLIISNEYLYTRFLTSGFSQPSSSQLSLGITGELCTNSLFQKEGDQCQQKMSFPAPIRSFSDQDRENATNEISASLASDESDMVLSLSEEYLNRFIHTTIRAELWNEALQEQHLSVGPKGAFIVFNQKTRNPELFLDLIYSGDGKGVQKLLINNRKPLRFPLRISTDLEFTNQDNIPHLIIRAKEVVSGLDEIINGIPEYELPSRLIPGVRKKIARMILEMSKTVNGQTVVDLDLPVLKDVELSNSRLEASAFGRLNLFYRF